MSSTHSRRRAAALALLAASVALGLAVVPAVGSAAPLAAGDDRTGPLAGLDAAAILSLEDDSSDDGTLAGGTVTANASVATDDGDGPLAVDADLEADATVESDEETVANASLGASAGADGASATVGVGADAGVSVAADASGGATVDAGIDRSTDAATDDPADDRSDRETGAGSGDDGGDGTGGLPAPEDAAAGLAVGSLLVGGGLLGRRAVEAALATGGSGGSLPSAALAWLRAWGWRLLALAGYHRLEETDPLEHETREAIYAHLRDSPGVFLTALADAVDVPLSTLRYHLRVLEDEGLVTSAKVRGKRRYFPADADPDALAAALEDEATAAVLEALAAAPDSVTGLADRLGRDPSTVSHHLQRLDDEGLVERERDGRSVVNRLAEGLDASAVAPATAGPAATGAD